MRTNALTVVMFALLQTSCGDSSRYPLRLYDLTNRQLLERATLVVVGTTADAKWEPARRPISWSMQPGVSSAGLVKVRLNIEQVIRGEVNSGQITAYYWGADIFTNASSLQLPNMGERRAVHYLVREQGILRYVRDIMRSTTVVFSGGHLKPAAFTTETAEQTIARILLTPGEGMDAGEFTHNLPTTVADALQLAGFTETLPLLRDLSANPDWNVKWSACVQLYRSAFIGQDGCIDNLLPTAREHGRESELRALQLQRTNAHFRNAFLADPIRIAKDYALLPGNAGIADFLRIIAQHPHKELAARARKALEGCCHESSPP